MLDGGEDQIFMGENKFKRFMGQVEQVAAAPTPQPMSATPQPAATTELLAAAAGLFTNLATTLADKQKSERLVASFVEKDEQTGKTSLKIPMENEQAITNALNSFSNFLAAFR